MSRFAGSLVLLLLLSIPVLGGSFDVDASCTGTPAVGYNFSFLVNAPVGGVSSQCFLTMFSFQTLDFFFTAPPTPADLTSCTSTFFNLCTITETAGITDVHYAAGTNTGIPAATDFDVVLTGFTTGQKINAVGNIPEPGGAWLVLSGLIAAAGLSAWRRARRRSGPGSRASGAAG